MAQEVTLGGDRLGSGNKQKVKLHSYEMSSFNLEQDFKSSMAPGILYPFLKCVGTLHDTFDIDLDSYVCTLPTKGPLYGSFKLQLDVFAIPIRLYQGILHNNPTSIGLKMNQVYLPKLKLWTRDGVAAPRADGSNDYNRQINESALLKYLGMSGIASLKNQNTGTGQNYVTRKINAVPALAYYDIFKCYYSNKQEEKAYVIVPGNIEEKTSNVTHISWQSLEPNKTNVTYETKAFSGNQIQRIFDGQTENWTKLVLQFWTDDNKPADLFNITLSVDDRDQEPHGGNLGIQEMLETGVLTKVEGQSQEWPYSDIHYDEYILDMEQFMQVVNDVVPEEILNITLEINRVTLTNTLTSDIKLQEFDLKNIDEMRNMLLSANTLGEEFVIQEGGPTEFKYPYRALVETTDGGLNFNAFMDNGLVVKTYQSDLFNNWLNTEYITGENGIANLSKITVDQSGSFTMDTLNLAEKIYEVLNRIAVSGGTYEDWQEAVWGEGAVRKAETPMYMGGMAAEIMFEQVISNSETKVDGDYQPLGSLGGKGKQVDKKGGNNIHIKCDEPTYIMGIASITPRICYNQGNDWDLTELDTLDDLHKPGFDGIGFQDLMIEQMAWWDTKFSRYDGENILERNSAGKQTAWINYQTAVDKSYGDFARTGGLGFMALNRNYERAYDSATGLETVKDITTYIDPAKYNYAFAYTTLAAQNFWVQIHSNVIARRKMGAQQIPNL